MADRAHLHRAAQRGDIGAVRALVQAVDVNIRGGWRVESPLHAASRAGRPDVIMCLMEAGAHTEVRDRNNDTPLLLAAWLGHALAVQKLLIAGARVDAEGIPRSALHCACMQGHAGCVRELLRGGADELSVDEDGNTPSQVVGTMSEAAGRPAGDLAAIHQMLESAAVDRAWRRRSWLVMLRARECAAACARPLPPLPPTIMTRSATKAAAVEVSGESLASVGTSDGGHGVAAAAKQDDRISPTTLRYLLQSKPPVSKRAKTKHAVQRKEVVAVTRRSREGKAVGQGERKGSKRASGGGGSGGGNSGGRAGGKASSSGSRRNNGGKREKGTGKGRRGRKAYSRVRGRGSDEDGEGRRELMSLVQRTIGLGEEGAFRSIVSFL